MTLAAIPPKLTSAGFVHPPNQVNQPDMPTISKELIRQRFDKASHSYQAHNGVQKRIAEALLDMMSGKIATEGVLLDLGCGPGPDWQVLRQRCEQYIGIDLSAAMLSAHHGCQDPRAVQLIQGDMERLPLATASVDTLYSGMAMQWAESPRRLCKELGRVLKPGANAFISVPLQGSLQPLGQIRESIDAQTQVNPQPLLQDWVDAWVAAGGIIECAEQRTFTEYFADLKRLLQSIKGVGAGANQARPLTRSSLNELAAGYEQIRTVQGLPLRYQVGLLHVKRTSVD